MLRQFLRYISLVMVIFAFAIPVVLAQTEIMVTLDAGEITIDGTTFTEPGTYPATETSTITWGSDTEGTIALLNGAVIDLGESLPEAAEPATTEPEATEEPGDETESAPVTTIQLGADGIRLVEGGLFVIGADAETFILVEENPIVIGEGETGFVQFLDGEPLQEFFAQSLPTDIIFWGANVCADLLEPVDVVIDLNASDPVLGNVTASLLRAVPVEAETEEAEAEATVEPTAEPTAEATAEAAEEEPFRVDLYLYMGSAHITDAEPKAVAVILPSDELTVNTDEIKLIVLYLDAETRDSIENLLGTEPSTFSWAVDAIGVLLLGNGATIDLNESIPSALGLISSIQFNETCDGFTVLSGSVLVEGSEEGNTEIVLPFGVITLDPEADVFVMLLADGTAILNTGDDENTDGVTIECEVVEELPPNENGDNIFACTGADVPPEEIPTSGNGLPSLPGQ